MHVCFGLHAPPVAAAKEVVKDFQNILRVSNWPEAARTVVAVRQPCVTFQVTRSDERILLDRLAVPLWAVAAACISVHCWASACHEYGTDNHWQQQQQQRHSYSITCCLHAHKPGHCYMLLQYFLLSGVPRLINSRRHVPLPSTLLCDISADQRPTVCFVPVYGALQ